MKHDDHPQPPPSLDALTRAIGSEPPTAPAAEQALIGRLILDPGMLGDVSTIVTPDDFAAEANRAIAETLTRLYDDGGQADVTQLVEALRESGRLAMIGGIERIVELVEIAGQAEPAAARDHARIVARKASQRRLREATHRAIMIAADPEADPADIAQGIEQATQDAAGGSMGLAPAVNAGDIAAEVVRGLATDEGGSSVRTGFTDLDRMLNGGPRPGQVIVLGGRPGQGKTAVALNMLSYAATMDGVPGLLFSMEMSRAEITERLVSSLAGVPVQRMKGGQMASHEADSVASAVADLEASRLIIEDAGGLTLTGIRSRAIRHQQRHAIGWIVIDYLQLMTGGNSRGRDRGRENEVAEISRGIKALAKELGVPIMALSQLSRGVEGRDDKRPRMSDLRESGSIEQDADTILMVYREDYYHRGEADYEPTNTLELIVAKQRGGENGAVKLAWDGPTTTARNMARPEDVAQAQMYG